MKEEAELIAWLKAPAKNWGSIKEAITAAHPYEVPCIIKFDCEANRAFTEWVLE